MTELSTKQRVTRFIKSHEGSTSAEISRGLGLCKSAVNEAIKRLKEDGKISVRLDGNRQQIYPGIIEDKSPQEAYGVNRMVDFFNRRISLVREGGEHAK
ncbi:MarR family transcriptional regulator [Sodalis ligni]|uniref:MarR family transcriptional regulator n=1 Tax=Sodalis ligni TaxID=2697027 RepID=UPI00193F9B13|nr:helix-turn-helix domain-containing protein [Sodalis ligni]QWA09551.1 MarR family transcriptional regulator [Sodalis ligni]